MKKIQLRGNLFCMSKSFQVEINHHKATVKKLDKQRKKVVSITQSSSNSQLDKVG